MPNSDKVLLIGQDGATAASASNPVPTTATISGSVTVNSDGKATAAAPTYVEGTLNPISMDLSGNQRFISATSATMTASQITVPATANGIQILAANASRKGATIQNPGPLTVYIQQAATGVTVSNGFGIPAGMSYNIDSPLYVGAIYGIIASGTQVITAVELT